MRPLEYYVGAGALDFEGVGAGVALGYDLPATDEQLEQRHAHQQAVADCMAERGFEYVPHVVDRSLWDAQYTEVIRSIPPREYAERFGYGITTDNEELRAQIDLPANPNGSIRDALSESEREAYDLALHGAGDARIATSSVAPDDLPEDAACVYIASAQIARPLGADEIAIDEFPGLFGALQTLGERIDTDPRLDVARQDWSDCMANRSFSGLADVHEANFSIADQLFETRSAYDFDKSDGLTDEERDAKQQFEAERAELAEYEIEIAVADFDCREAEYNTIFDEVRREYESDFVEQNRDVLERYREWAEAIRANAAKRSE